MQRDRLCLVVNPAAGRGRCTRALPAVLGALGTRPAGVRVCQTTSLHHAERTAAEAARQGEAVVAVGGDGLVGSLAGAVAGEGGLLGIIPVGRGNDFARMLGIPFRPADAAAALLAGTGRAVDLIGVRAGDGPEQVVAGSVYLGVPSEGGEIANGSRMPTGPVGYQLAGMRALLGWRPATFTVDIRAEDTGAEDTGAENTGAGGGGAEDGAGGGAMGRFPGFCVVVANSAYLAAGKKAAPAADLCDGLLDVITVRGDRKLSFARAMLMAGRGTHVRLDEVSTQRAASVTVTADRPMPAGADGETLPCASPLAAGSPLRIRALPGALRVIAPAHWAAQHPQPSPGTAGRAWPPRKESTKAGLDDSSAGVPTIRTSPPPST